MKRNTRQGTILSEVIRTADRPLTPLEIHGLAVRKIPHLGIATTYRHLKSLTESNQVVGVDYPGQPPRYEWADGKDKVHFACRSCDKLFALDDTTEDTPPAKAPDGFKVQGFEVMLYGVCPECG
jgi:Fur family ferric uptake transcriptional regulator